MKSSVLPTTTLGKWSIGLIISAFVLFLVFMIEVAAGFRGGDTFSFTEDFWQGLPILLAGVCAIISMVTGIIGIVKSKERSVFVFLATAFGCFALIFVAGEFLSPH